MSTAVLKLPFVVNDPEGRLKKLDTLVEHTIRPIYRSEWDAMSPGERILSTSNN